MRAIQAEARPHGASDPQNFVLPALTQKLLGPDDGAPLRLYRVTFGEGGRTNWHRHDDVQVLFGLEGRCVVVDRDGTELFLDPGGVVVIEPHEEHWHGAAPGGSGAHLAVNAGSHTVWLEPS